jgi:hypothetical protein
VLLCEIYDGVLYHGTDLQQAVSILKQGVIKPQIANAEAGVTKAAGVSLTRNPRYRYSGMGEYHRGPGEGLIQFVLDRAKIKQTAKLTPFNYHDLVKDQNTALGRDVAEERAHGELRLDPVCVGVQIFASKDQVSPREQQYLEEILELCNQRGIPVQFVKQ